MAAMIDPTESARTKLRRIVTSVLVLLACAPWVHAAAASEAGSEEAGTGAGALPEGIVSDRNGDGVLTEDEVMPGMFSLLDVNRDGRAEMSEVRGFLARFLGRRLQLGQSAFRGSSPAGIDPRDVSESVHGRSGGLQHLPPARLRRCSEP